jgi:hypothetical protein
MIWSESAGLQSGGNNSSPRTFRPWVLRLPCCFSRARSSAALRGAESVLNVCSTCHVFQAQLSEKSPHKAAFSKGGFPGCVTCHSNHEIKHPTDEMIGTGSHAVCIRCHTEGDAGYKIAADMKTKPTELDSALTRSRIPFSAPRRSTRLSQRGVHARPSEAS